MNKCDWCYHPDSDLDCLCECHASQQSSAGIAFADLPDYVRQAIRDLNWKYGPRQAGFVYRDGRGLKWQYDGAKWHPSEDK